MIRALSLCAVLAWSGIPTAIPVTVDGEALPASALSSINGKTYVSLRAIGEALGAQAAYDPRLREVVLTTEFREVVMPLGLPIAFINGQRRTIDAPALLRNGKALVGLRSAVIALGASLGIDRSTHAIIVSSAGVNQPPLGGPTAPPVPSTNTLQGTVTDVEPSGVPPAVAVDVDHLTYTITVPEGTRIQFRDTRGGSTGWGPLAQVRSGDTLIATLDAGGRVISIADIFTGFSGTIAAVSAESFVLQSGHVVQSDKSQTAVTLDGRPASFSDLKAGDLATVRADPRTGKVRDVVALTPGALVTTATSVPTTSLAVASVRIDQVTDDATHAFRAGQTLHVALDGTAGGAASFDLSNVVVDNAMSEVQPGHYEGTYHVEVGTNLIDAPIIVHLAKDGASAQAEGPDPLAIITSPPAVQDAKPDASSEVNNPRPNIYVTFTTFGDRGMDAQSLKLLVNGKDVSAQATRTAEFISFYPAADFDAGPVSVQVSGDDTAGNSLSFKWSFTVVRAQM